MTNTILHTAGIILKQDVGAKMPFAILLLTIDRHEQW